MNFSITKERLISLTKPNSQKQTKGTKNLNGYYFYVRENSPEKYEVSHHQIYDILSVGSQKLIITLTPKGEKSRVKVNYSSGGVGIIPPFIIFPFYNPGYLREHGIASEIIGEIH